MADTPLLPPSSESRKLTSKELNRLPPSERVQHLVGRGKRVRKHPSELPQWAKLAIAENVTLGVSLKSLARKYGKSPQTLHNLSGSPAGKLWRAEMEKVANDPEGIAAAVLRASAANVSINYMLAMQAAIDAEDYREVGTMSRDILDRLGVTKKEKQSKRGKGSHQPTVVINLGGGVSLDVPQVESTFEEVPEADYEIVSDDDEE